MLRDSLLRALLAGTLTTILAASTAHAQLRKRGPDPSTLTPTPTIVALETTDDVTLAAAHVAPARVDGAAPVERRPAVLLLHGGGRFKERWWTTGLVRRLHAHRIHVLAIDIRRHGASEDGDLTALQQNPALAHHDVLAGDAWLRARDDVDPARIAIVGSSYGSNLLTYVLAACDLDLAGTVLLSPTRAAKHFLEHAESTHPITTPALILCTGFEPPKYEAEATAEYVKSLATHDATQLVVHIGSAHGAGILENVPGTLEQVERWLLARFEDRLAPPEPPTAPDADD